MNNPETLDPPASGAIPSKTQRPRPRLVFPTLCLLIFWVASFVVGAFNKPYFFGFIYGMVSALLVTLLFFGWWWFNRGLTWRDKCGGFGLILLEALLVGRFSHA